MYYPPKHIPWGFLYLYIRDRSLWDNALIHTWAKAFVWTAVLKGCTGVSIVKRLRQKILVCTQLLQLAEIRVCWYFANFQNQSNQTAKEQLFKKHLIGTWKWIYIPWYIRSPVTLTEAFHYTCVYDQLFDGAPSDKFIWVNNGNESHVNQGPKAIILRFS